MPDSSETPAVKLLLAEYEHLSATLTDSEGLGERRLKFLFTLVTAVLGGIGALLQLERRPGPPLVIAMLSALLLLLLFGLVTLERIVKRNVTTDECIDGLNAIRGYFIGVSDRAAELKTALLYYNPRPKERKFPRPWTLKPGGLAQGVGVINAVLVFSAVGLGWSLARLDPRCALAAAVVAGLVTWCAQCVLIWDRYREHRKESPRPDVRA